MHRCLHTILFRTLISSFKSVFLEALGAYTLRLTCLRHGSVYFSQHEIYFVGVMFCDGSLVNAFYVGEGGLSW